MNNYIKTKLGDIVDFNKISYSKKDNWDIINYLDTGNITENKIDNISYLDTEKDKIPSRAKRIVRPNDIVYSTVRPNQRHFGILDKPVENMLVSTGFAVISSKEDKADSHYIYYFLTQNPIVNALHAIAEQSVSTYPAIKSSDISNLLISLPPLPTQRRIAAILSSLDNKIENNRRICEKLEEMAQAIFKEWFVEFNFPNENGLPYKDNGGDMVESELGLIPRGWEAISIGKLADVKGGKRLPKGNSLSETPTKHPYIRVTDVTGGYVNTNGLKYVPNETWTHIKRYIISKDDIYISIAGTIGIVGLIPHELHNANLTENMAKICPFSKTNKQYIYQHLTSQVGQELIKSRTVGSTQPKLALFRIKDIPIVYPPESILSKFISLAENSRAKLDSCQLENIKLQKTRDTLLPKLMSGEIDLEEEGTVVKRNGL